MTLDELKQLLADGNITKAQFLAMAKAIDPDFVEDPDDGGEDDPDDAGNGANGGGKGKGDDLPPDLEKIIQRAVDRATNKLGNENKKLRGQLEKMKQDHLTEEQRKQFDIDERERTIADREQALKEKENRLYAIKAITAEGLNDGTENALELVEFVMADDEAAIDDRVKAFAALVQKFVKGEVDKTFKANGRTPGKGSGGGTEKNPWAKETWNMTEQMNIEINDPETAKRLKAAAGVK